MYYIFVPETCWGQQYDYWKQCIASACILSICWCQYDYWKQCIASQFRRLAEVNTTIESNVLRLYSVDLLKSIRLLKAMYCVSIPSTCWSQYDYWKQCIASLFRRLAEVNNTTIESNVLRLYSIDLPRSIRLWKAMYCVSTPLTCWCQYDY